MRKLLAFILLAWGCGTVYAQTGNTMHWEVRSYFRGSTYMEQNEFIFVVRTAGVERKTSVAVVSVQRYLAGTLPVPIPIEQVYPEQAIQIAVSDFTVTIEKNAVEITAKQDPRFGKAFQLDPDAPGIRVRIELPNAGSYRLTPEVAVDANTFFKRTLRLQKTPMQGDDVWVLQQALIKKGRLYPNQATGIFDAPTEEAVKQFQMGELLPSGTEPGGIVDSRVWSYILSPPAEIG